MAMRPGSDVRAGSTSNVHHGVVDGVADGANVFFGSARGSSHHARLDHGNAERGQNQNEANENHRRNRGSDGDKPRRVDGAEQKIGRSKNQVSQRERAAETETVRDRAAKNREKPNHTAKDSSERAGLLCRKIQLFVEIVGERSESAVVGKALENFRDVGDPEGALEAGADFVESLAEAHFFSAWKRSDCNGPKKRRDRKSTRLNSSHDQISYAVFCLKKKKQNKDNR